MKKVKNGSSDRLELLREYSVKITHDDSPNGIYWNSHDRFVWIVTLLLGCMCIYSARTVMPLCIVSIADELHWDKQQSGTILSTFFWGYATTQLLGGHMADKYGGDLVMVFACVGWAGLTLLTPLVPYLVQETTLLLFVMTLARVFIGVFQGLHYPSVTSLISKNVDVKHRSFTFSAVVTGSNLGTLLSGSVGSVIVESQGWRPTFLCIGIFGAVWCGFMWFHMSKKQRRRRLLLQAKRRDQPLPLQTSEGVPWAKLVRAPAFWSTIICHMTETNCFFILLSWLPSYFHDKFPDAKLWQRRHTLFLTSSLRRIYDYRWQDYVSDQQVLDRAEMRRVSCLIRERQLRFYGHVVRFPEDDPAHRILSARDPSRPVRRPRASWTIAWRKPDQWRRKGWVFNVVPWLVSIPCSFLCGWLADALISHGWSVTKTRKMSETVAQFGASLLLLVISYTEQYELSVTFMALAVGCLTFHHTGCLMAPQDIAPDHAGSVFGVMNMCGAVPGFVGVYVVGYILEQTKNWSYVFVLNSVVTMFGWLVFMIFGTGERIA